MRALLAAALLLLLAAAYFGWFRPDQDAKRMDALAADVRRQIHPGMTLADATRSLDQLGVSHSDPVSARDDPGAHDNEKTVVYAMIRHNVQPWSLVCRDVQLRVYLNADGAVARTDIRDVFTGP